MFNRLADAHPNLRKFVGTIRTALPELTAQRLRPILQNAAITQHELSNLLEFESGEHFCHRMAYLDDRLEIGCNGWLPGQHSLVHDHGYSLCGVLVVQGIMTSEDFRRDRCDDAVMVRTHRLSTGDILIRSGADIHRLGNDRENLDPLVTLHCYAPPLKPLPERLVNSSN